MSRSGPGVGTLSFELRIRELDTDAPLTELTQRIAQALESEILRVPEEWLWMANRRRLDLQHDDQREPVEKLAAGLEISPGEQSARVVLSLSANSRSA